MHTNFYLHQEHFYEKKMGLLSGIATTEFSVGEGCYLFRQQTLVHDVVRIDNTAFNINNLNNCQYALGSNTKPDYCMVYITGGTFNVLLARDATLTSTSPRSHVREFMGKTVWTTGLRKSDNALRRTSHDRKTHILFRKKDKQRTKK